MTTPPLLDDLLAGAPAVRVRHRTGPADVRVGGITLDSRQVRPGWLFACLPGATVDGHDFADAAVEAGASVLLVERPLGLPVAQVVVPDTRAALGPLAAAFHGHPSEQLLVFGVTGTNGKTTTTHLLASILRAAGHRPEVIGTLTGRHTTPEAPDLQALLASFVAEGVTAVAMEVSSHALALHRVDGIRFAVGVFTNLGRDHLDFHSTPERYFAAKARLFEPSFCSAAVVNVDDPHGRLLFDAAQVPTTSFSLTTDVERLRIEPARCSFHWHGRDVVVPVGGRFNAENALAAATAAEVAGIALDAVVEGLASTPPVPGRFEAVDEGQGFTVLVDYAHTPDGLREALQAAREAAAGRRVIVVFGCGGDRDAQKRPEMGAVAAEHADVVVVTSDNPRSEDPAAIIEQVLAGVPASARPRVRTDADRAAAIELAVGEASPGDVVVIAGKGHETTQTVGSEVRPFVDRDVAAAALEESGAPMTVLMIAVWTAGIVSLFGTRYVIIFFQRLGKGQPILGKEDRGPEHQHKAGTPTMGGIAIVGAAFVGWLVPHLSRGLPFSDQALAVWFAVFVLGFIGFLDDYIKVRRARNRGIFWKAKGWITLLVCILLVAVLVLVVNDFATTINLTRADWPGWDLPKILFVIWGGFIVFATANAVNVTDGLDGLAAGTSMMGFAAYALIAFWGFRNQEVFPAIVNPLDLAVLAAAFAGALAGFLWWNAPPAKVFMGDVGALGLGAGMGMLALTTNTALLLPIIAGMQVIIILSVAIQMTSFKLFHRRVFRLSPLHHHFELVGWPETRILIRFWLISALFVGTGVAIYYADWYRVAKDLGLIP